MSDPAATEPVAPAAAPDDGVPTTDIVVAEPPDMTRGAMTGTSLAVQIAYARELAQSDLLPGQFRKRPENVVWAVQYANMLGIHPLSAVTGIHVMDGKPTASAALMSALVRKAGHRMRVKTTGTIEAGDFAATAEITRSDDPSFTFSATWTLQRALRAGLIDRLDTDQAGRVVVVSKTKKGEPGNYEKYPEAMVKARAITEVAREACEEALCGVHYSPEELGAQVDEDGVVVIEGSIADEREAAERPAELPPPDPDALRADVLNATTKGEWMQAWFRHGGRGSDPGKIDGTMVLGEDGVTLVNALDLFMARRDVIAAADAAGTTPTPAGGAGSADPAAAAAADPAATRPAGSAGEQQPIPPALDPEGFRARLFANASGEDGLRALWSALVRELDTDTDGLLNVLAGVVVGDAHGELVAGHELYARAYRHVRETGTAYLDRVTPPGEGLSATESVPGSDDTDPPPNGPHGPNGGGAPAPAADARPVQDAGSVDSWGEQPATDPFTGQPDAETPVGAALAEVGRMAADGEVTMSEAVERVKRILGGVVIGPDGEPAEDPYDETPAREAYVRGPGPAYAATPTPPPPPAPGVYKRGAEAAREALRSGLRAAAGPVSEPPESGDGDSPGHAAVA